MKTTLIAIGNSRGIHIPKPLIEQCGFLDEVELDIHDKSIIIHAPNKPRAGWDDAFEKMSRLGDDHLLYGDVLPKSSWDAEEWAWK